MPLVKIDILTEKEYALIEEMGGTGFSIPEIAEVIEVPAAALERAFRDKENQVYRRYRKGYLLSSLTLRQRIFKDAGHGSSPAQTLAKKIMDDCDYKMKGYE